EKPILNSLSLRFQKGKRTALVGESGAGKSTILKLLMRFYDCPSGSIFVDGCDIREFTQKSLVNQFSLLGQDVILLNTSVRENLLFGVQRETTEKELLQILDRTKLREFIQALPHGLDTIVGENGTRLSGGERQ